MILSNREIAPSHRSPPPFSSYAHHLSHELRTPLNHIQGFAELLLMDDAIRSSHGDYIRAILEGSDALQAAVLSHLKYVEAFIDDVR